MEACSRRPSGMMRAVVSALSSASTRQGRSSPSCPSTGSMLRLSGAFSCVIMDDGYLSGVRDPNGFRPLCLGRLPEGWVLASETPALDIVGAHFVRELEPGEMVVVDATGTRSLHPFPADAVDPKLCLFEFLYFARPDSPLYGQTVHTPRQ